jgi:hypothetical protein
MGAGKNIQALEGYEPSSFLEQLAGTYGVNLKL